MARKTTSRTAAKKPHAKKAAEPARRPARRPARKPARKPAAASARRPPRQEFLHRYEKEHETTMRVLRAFPPGQGEFRPHIRSNSVNGLIYTMLFEQELSRRVMAGEPAMGGPAPTKPENLEAGLAAFDKGYHAIADMARKTPDAKLRRIVQFPVAKGQMGDWTALDFMWYMLVDHIHHRGQLTVYLRLAGGKVPSIYGPSADEPWS